MERILPERFVKRKELNFLLRELALWRDAAIIDEEQASAIERLYAPRRGHFSQILLGLGGMLVGLGLLSAVAANWLDIPRVFRAALILACYLLSLLAAWRMERALPRTSRALLLLGSFVYGGGIFLMAQMFHQGGHWTTALAWWFAGVLPVALLFRDPLQVLLLQVIALVFLWGDYVPMHWLFRRSFGVSVFYPWEFFWVLLWPPQRFLVTLSSWLAWRFLEERRRLGFGMNILITLVFFAFPTAMYFEDLALCLAALSGVGILMVLCAFGERKDDMAGWGILLAGVGGLLLTIPDVWSESPVLEWFPAVSSLFSKMGFALPGTGFAVMSALIFCLLMLGLTCKGHAAATFFFCLLVLRYYFDRFYDFMPKAAFFTVGGLLLIGLGTLMGRLRRRAGRGREVGEEEERT